MSTAGMELQTLNKKEVGFNLGSADTTATRTYSDVDSSALFADAGRGRRTVIDALQRDGTYKPNKRKQQAFFSTFYAAKDQLPRQARDRHGASTNKGCFLAVLQLLP